jgi:hypothetical protein
MGLLASSVASISIGDYVILAIYVAILVVNYFAISLIIGKAGFSRAWIILPLIPVGLTIAGYVILYHDFHEIFTNGSFGVVRPNSDGLIWELDLLSIFVNWVFFIIFATIRWPVADGRSDFGRSKKSSIEQAAVQVGASATPTLGPRRSPGVPARSASTAVAAPATSTTPESVTASPSAGTRGKNHCIWCGEVLPGNRALFHNCGSKDRPAAFCRDCGDALVDGSSSCANCGSPSES